MVHHPDSHPPEESVQVTQKKKFRKEFDQFFQDTSGSSATGTNFLEAAASPYRDHVGMAAYSPYGLSHAERSRHAITSLHLANHYPTTEAGLAAEKVREGDGTRDTKPLLWSQYDHKYPSPGAAGALCSPSSQPPEPCPPHQSWPTAYSQPHPSHYPGLEVFLRFPISALGQRARLCQSVKFLAVLGRAIQMVAGARPHAHRRLPLLPGLPAQPVPWWRPLHPPPPR